MHAQNQELTRRYLHLKISKTQKNQRSLLMDEESHEETV